MLGLFVGFLSILALRAEGDVSFVCPQDTRTISSKGPDLSPGRQTITWLETRSSDAVKIEATGNPFLLGNFFSNSPLT